MATAQEIENRARKAQDRFYPDIELNYQAREINTRPLFWVLRVLYKGKVIGQTSRFEDTDDLDEIENQLAGYLGQMIKDWLENRAKKTS